MVSRGGAEARPSPLAGKCRGSASWDQRAHQGQELGRSPLWAPVRGESRPGNPVTLLESRLQITPLRPVLVPTQPNQVTPIADPFL